MTQSALSPERLTMLYRLVNGYMVLQCLPNTNSALMYGMDSKKFTSLVSCGKAGSHRKDWSWLLDTLMP
jgi:hypothetical protein